MKVIIGPEVYLSFDTFHHEFLIRLRNKRKIIVLPAPPELEGKTYSRPETESLFAEDCILFSNGYRAQAYLTDPFLVFTGSFYFKFWILDEIL